MPVRANILNLQRRRTAGGSSPVSDPPIFEWNADNALPTGSYSNLVYDFGATRSTSDPIEGTHSILTASQGFSQVQIYNWVSQFNRAWAPTNKGRIALKFRYPTTFVTAAMLFQMDGKWTAQPTWESNEGISIITTTSGGRNTVTVGILGTTLTVTGIDLLAATIYSFEVWYDKDCGIDGFKSLKVFINGKELGYAVRALDAAVVAEWYHISFGNDKNAPWIFQLDSLKIWNNVPAYVAPAPVVLINEGFEGGVIPAGWVAQSSNLDYNYTAAPINGSKSCRMAFNAVAYTLLPATYDFIEARFRFRIETLPTATASFLEFRTADDSALVAGFGISTSGGIGVRGTTNSGFTTDTAATATDYYGWVGFQSSVLSHVAFSTTPTRPRTGNKYIGLNLGPTANQVGRFTLRRSQGIVCVLDDIYVTSTLQP